MDGTRKVSQHTGVPQGDHELEALREQVASRTHPSLLPCLVIDIAMYVALFWRDYGVQDGSEVNAAPLIAHYVSWITITDVLGYAIPRERSMWFLPFRLLGALQLMQLTFALWYDGIDAGAATGMLALFIVRVALCQVRAAHAALLWYGHGPHAVHWDAVFEYIRVFLAVQKRRFGAALNFLHLSFLCAAVLVTVTPQLSYLMHWNFGDGRVDVALVSAQGGNALNVMLKTFVLNAMVGDIGRRAVAQSLIAFLFIVQWPVLLVMYSNAPFPYLHAVAEVLFASYAAVLVYVSR